VRRRLAGQAPLSRVIIEILKEFLERAASAR